MLLVAIVLGISISLERLDDPSLANLKVQVAEYLMVHAKGPRFGSRPASKDIVMIDFDLESGNQFGHLRSIPNDVKLYRKLSKTGLSMIYDSRSFVAGGPEELERLRPALNTALELNGISTHTDTDQTSESLAEKQPNLGIRFILDVWLPASIADEDLSKFAPAISTSPISISPHAIDAARVRMFPLAHASPWGLEETVPLKLARGYWGLNQVVGREVNEELYNCGILTEWHRQYPVETAPVDEPRKPLRIGNNDIPWYPFASSSLLVLPGALWISHDPLVHEFRRITYADVMKTEQLDSLDLDGKIAIIGYTTQTDPASDTYDLPSAKEMCPPADIVALATQTLLDRRWMQPIPRSIGIAVLILLCVGLTTLTTILKPAQAMLAALVVLLLYFASAIVAYRTGWFMDFALTPVVGILCAVLSGTLSAWNSHRTHNRVVDMFGRYIPRAVVNQLIQQPQLDALRLGGTKREVSVLFADIRGFTSFSEKMPPDQVVTELNGLLKIMVDCTFEYKGTLDKFIGDAILVLFNAPLDQSDHVARAVRMAMDMQHRLVNHRSQLSIGIGVHVGQAVVGNIGTPERMEYTAIGSTVNIASRLCDIARAGQVIVSSQVAQLLREQFESQLVGPVNVKGISQPIEVWEVHKAL